MIFEPSIRPRLSTDQMAAGQCVHERWFKNGYDKKTGKPVRCCFSCHKKEIVGRTRALDPLLTSRLKFVPLWLAGVASKEAARQLRVHYHTVRKHYRAIQALYAEHTGQVRRVDGRAANKISPEARAARLAKPKVKAAGA